MESYSGVMRARTLVFAVLLFTVMPAVAEAAPHLFWGNPEWDPNTGALIQASVASITDNTDAAVPFNVSKGVWVEYAPNHAGIGLLYFVPQGGGPRELVATIGGIAGVSELAWTRGGSYELDVYNPLVIIEVRSNAERFFTWLFGEHAYAQNIGKYVGTIHFNIHEKSADGAPSVLFIPGMKGSVLKVGNDTVWPPDIWSDDLPELALTAAGESVNPVVVDGPLETFYGTPIYGGFSSFMNELVATGTVAEWEPLPYDWRFSPERILADGIQTPTGTVDPVQEVEMLAAHSSTGKVVVVAHSMGGLLGKALIKKLDEKGEANLIDSFIMVGVPQLGTPQAIASLLHGDGEGILAGFIVNPAIARQIAQNFQSAYDLLPSPRYFDEVTDAPIVFDPIAAFTQAWRDYWGPAIDSYAEFFSFVTGGGVARIKPDFSDLHRPEILRTDLTENARDFHATYDTYVFPPSIRVVQIAGWGIPTVKTIDYKMEHFAQNYEPLFTIEGDDTVVYPSATSSVADETYFLNLEKYRKEKDKSAHHRDLLSATPVQDIVNATIKNEIITETNYLTQSKPSANNLIDQLIVSAHSPVILGAYDQGGHFSGINQNQNLGADVLSVTEDIPGSTFLSFADSQYLFLPKTGPYTMGFKGLGAGLATVAIENFAGDTATPIATYSDILITASTSATFVVNSSSPQDTHIQVDSNNDGQVDMYVAPDNQPLTFNELLVNLKTVIRNLAVKDKLKTNLLKKVANMEKKIAKQKNKKASKTVMNLEKQITRKANKDKISDTEAQDILNLLSQIENAL